jgi:hypothetical protein
MSEILHTEGATSFVSMINKQPSLFTFTGNEKTKNTTPIVRDLETSHLYASWFTEDNRFPTKILEAAKADPELYPFIDSFAKSLYSGGIIYGQWAFVDGKMKFNRVYDAEIELWLEDSNIQMYLQEAFIDGKMFSNAWAELDYDIRGNGLGHITQLSIQDAVFCRFGKQNKRGIKDRTYVSADWDDTVSDVQNYFTIDPYYKPLQQVVASKKDIIYYPLVFPGMPGNIYYQIAPWHGLLKSKILELSRLMIEFKHHFLKNGMSIKYHVEVSKKYFALKYRDRWEKGDEKARMEIMQSEVSTFNDLVSGVENAGKTFLTFLEESTDPRLQGYSTWKITPIDMKTVSGEYTNDMNQNTLIKLRGLDYDPAIAGGISGDSGKMGGGSGSDARVAFNIHQIKNKPMQDIVLSPLNKVIKHVNGWEKRFPGLTFMTESLFLATQDQVPPAQRL